MPCAVFETPPLHFQPKLEAGGCYLEWEGKILLLQNSLDDTEPGTWGIPGGKFEKGELPSIGAARELREETGLILESSELIFLATLYMRKPAIDYLFHLFVYSLKEPVEIVLSSEHSNYCWASPQDMKTLPLMDGAKEAYAKYLSI
jgi:8-oxo-dGTP pyrophosphatase MutT (NUDIX family)